MSERLIRKPKGTQDILPNESPLWQYAESMLADVAGIFGFKEIRTPIFEYTELFTGAVGDSSDIVQKEMYTFLDKGQRSISLRPELTAGVVRAALENGLLGGALPLKTYYFGPCFRYERPQAGRFRQFHQFGVECFGTNEASADAELIMLALDALEALGIEGLVLKLNSIGCADCRADYLDKLRDYFKEHEAGLDEEAKGRLEANPMRILDTKVESTRLIADGAPKPADYLCKDCKAHFEALKRHLDLFKIEYELDKDLVRGLDYYTNTVFEIVSSNIGAQGSVCGGGRYNLLVEERGGKPTPALGFAMGLERLLLEMAVAGAHGDLAAPQSDIYIASMGDLPSKRAFILTQMLRAEGFYAERDVMARSLKAQMKYAAKIGAKYVLIIGEDELLLEKGKLRNMESGIETEVPLGEELVQFLYHTGLEEAIAELDPKDIIYSVDEEGED